MTRHDVFAAQCMRDLRAVAINASAQLASTATLLDELDRPAEAALCRKRAAATDLQLWGAEGVTRLAARRAQADQSKAA